MKRMRNRQVPLDTRNRNEMRIDIAKTALLTWLSTCKWGLSFIYKVCVKLPTWSSERGRQHIQRQEGGSSTKYQKRGEGGACLLPAGQDPAACHPAPSKHDGGIRRQHTPVQF